MSVARNSTVLALVQTFCREMGLPVPGALQGSSDAGALQMSALFHRVGTACRGTGNWQQCTSRSTLWPSTGVSIQGDVRYRAASGSNSVLLPQHLFESMIEDTFWNITAKVLIKGPIPQPEWDAQDRLGTRSYPYIFQVRYNSIYVNPIPPVTNYLQFSYITRGWIAHGDENFATDTFQGLDTLYTAIVADNDSSVFSDALMLAGLRAYWLRTKQMPHRLEMEEFDDLRMAECAKGTIRPTLQMDGVSGGTSGIVVPRYNAISV